MHWFVGCESALGTSEMGPFGSGPMMDLVGAAAAVAQILNAYILSIIDRKILNKRDGGDLCLVKQHHNARPCDKKLFVNSSCTVEVSLSSASQLLKHRERLIAIKQETIKSSGDLEHMSEFIEVSDERFAKRRE